MNNDQNLVATMVVILIALVAWTTYKPWLKAILFTAPTPSNAAPTPSWLAVPGIAGLGLVPALLMDQQGAATGTASAGLPMTTEQLV